MYAFWAFMRTAIEHWLSSTPGRPAVGTVGTLGVGCTADWFACFDITEASSGGASMVSPGRVAGGSGGGSAVSMLETSGVGCLFLPNIRQPYLDSDKQKMQFEMRSCET